MDPKKYTEIISNGVSGVLKALHTARMSVEEELEEDQSINLVPNILTRALATATQILSEELRGQYDEDDPNGPENIQKIKEKLVGVVAESLVEIAGPGYLAIRKVVDPDAPEEDKAP